ncbi:collagen-binding domain-containing protein [Cellulomonas sp. Leaf334]|uniref:collagen-binding domain-containing protein n=1 Tax=Cellulomonas sp. Leaf334 TaxID=1736339 RepID=UPI0006F294AA|nr:collagen-binding domain-containing protein [Cellulomonas sp. Leaf334]KQR08583.1 hypothetical protein ASF78_20290 [Cellulomonas sp. Leaf334]
MHVARPGAKGIVASVAAGALLIPVLAAAVAVGAATTASAVNVCGLDEDPTLGFTVLVEGDASMSGSEVEGTLGVGGSLSWASTFDVRHSTGLTPPDYPLPTIPVGGADVPVRVAAGAYDLAGSQGVLQVGAESDDPAWPRGEMFAGSSTWTTTSLSGEQVFIDDGGPGQARVLPPNPPASEGDLATWVPANIGPVDVTPVTAGFGDLDTLADAITDVTGTTDGISEVSLAGGPSEKQLELVAGDINVLSVTPEALDGVTALSFTGAVPSLDTPLVIRMSGGTAFNIPRMNGANDSGTNNLFAPYVLWSYADAGPLTISSQGLITGTVLAPRADVTLENSSPLEGQLIAASLVKPGGTGEIHHYAFAACVPDDDTTTGTVALSKTLVVDGTFDTLPIDVTVQYWVDGVRQLPDLSVAVDGTLLGPVTVPSGELIELGEPTPPAVPGGVWQTPVWAVTGATTTTPTQPGAQVAFVVEEDAQVAVSLTDTLAGQGRFSIAKSLDDAGLGSPDTFTFQWWVNDVAQTPDLVVAADGTVLGPIDVAPDSVIELLEVAPADPAGGTWTAPTFDVVGGTPATPQHGGFAFTVGRGSAVSAVTVTNVVEPDPVPVTGGFAVQKVVAGAVSVVPPGAVFTGTWTCDAAGAAGTTSGTWSVAAGATAVVAGFPVGTTCVVAEDATQPGGTFTATLVPADGTVVVAAGDPTVAGLVTVTNTYPAPPTPRPTPAPDDSELAVTGADGAQATAVAAAVALLVGAALVLATRRHTPASIRHARRRT